MINNDKDWWEYYIEGKIIRRDNTPLSIINTLKDWSRDTCVKNDPMIEFVNGKPVDPRKLQLEIAICVSENSLEKERERLKALEVWIIRECALAETAKELREAEIAFHEAASAAGLDAYHTYKIATGPT